MGQLTRGREGKTRSPFQNVTAGDPTSYQTSFNVAGIYNQ